MARPSNYTVLCPYSSFKKHAFEANEQDVHCTDDTEITNFLDKMVKIFARLIDSLKKSM